MAVHDELILHSELYNASIIVPCMSSLQTKILIVAWASVLHLDSEKCNTCHNGPRVLHNNNNNDSTVLPKTSMFVIAAYTAVLLANLDIMLKLAVHGVLGTCEGC